MTCVPFMSLVVVGRQVYLSSRYGLSTWKGGGMGMFAAADELSNRYAKVFLIGQKGDRNPLVQLSSDDTDLLNRALEFPTRKLFLRAARQIWQENWIPAYQERAVLEVNGDGNPIGAGDKSYRVMARSELRPESDQARSSIEIQFWKLSYVPGTRHVSAKLVEKFVFWSEELSRPAPEQNKS